MTEAEVKKPVIVFFGEEHRFLECDQRMTMAEVRKEWQDSTDQSISVAFCTQDERYLPDDLTIAEALANSSARSLELHAFPKSSCRLQVFGFDETCVQFEVADVLTPAAVWREIGAALDIYTDDFRLTLNGTELDQELPLKGQGFMQGVQMTVDLRVIVKVNFDDCDETRIVECFSSECIGDLHQKLNFGDDRALVATSPYRHFLAHPWRVCYIVADHMDLQIPMELTAEKKIMLAFEPITLQHRRQVLPVALSCTPIDLYDMVSERFHLTTEHRLAINGQKLDNSEPLRNQIIEVDDVIQVDILRPCEVFDLWEDPWNINSYEEVYLYSTESAYALYSRDELKDQRLFHKDIRLTIFGSVADVFGTISGQHKCVLVIDRDVERSLPTLTLDGVKRSFCWARSMLFDVVLTSGGLPPKEIMHNKHLLSSKSVLNKLRLNEDTLTIMDPKTLFIHSDKKLRVCRFAHGATFGDVRAEMQRLRSSLDVGLKAHDRQIPDEAMHRKLDLEILCLTKANRFQTKLAVTLKNQQYNCRFESQQVSFSDVMINIGKQAKLMPRHLFQHSLYCCGCGRKLSAEEEPHQAIPATCCRVRSLQLTDRRVKDVGIQTAIPRRRDAQTYTLFPAERDACVGTEPANIEAVVSATPELESTATIHPSVTLGILVESPAGNEELSLASVGNSYKSLLQTAQRQSEIPVEDSPVAFTMEIIYERDGEERKAMRCYDAETADYFSFFDLQDGRVVRKPFYLRYSSRFLRLSAPLPPSPHIPLLVVVKTKVEILTANSRRQLEAAPVGALTDLSFVVLLFGIRSGTEFFWELAGDGLDYVHAESGRLFRRRRIPGDQKRFVFALLGDKDRVPSITIPGSRRLVMLCRDGHQVRVEQGCVRCARTDRSTDIERWDFPIKRGDFEKNFAIAANRR